MDVQKGAKVGLISRIDYGSKGFRQALINIAFDTFKSEGTHFNILVGGVVSQKAIIEEMKAFVKRSLNGSSKKKKKRTSEERFAKKNELEETFLKKIAQRLAKVIPITTCVDPDNPKQEKSVDLYIVPSPAFDGDVGEKITHFLAEIRPDIRPSNSGGDRLPVKYVNKLIWALTPQKAVWMRGDYYSTAVERVIKDKRKQTSQGSPDLFVVGGFGSSIQKPQGELEYQYVSVPACHRLEEVRVSENQIGVGILEFPLDDSSYLYRVYNFKDLVSQELSFVVAPNGTTVLQKKIIEAIKSRGWVTRGLLKYDTGASAEEIERALTNLIKKKTFRRMGENWPGIYCQTGSQKYYFDLAYIQQRLKYAPYNGQMQEDRIVSFACLHAGSVETDYGFFVNKLPEIILRSGASILVDAGDTKEGTRHNLMMKGEIVAGMNNTKQELVAANMVGGVMLKVFKARFLTTLTGVDTKEISTESAIYDLTDRCLIRFVYILGNHDTWEAEDGHDPLVVFHLNLSAFLAKEINALLLSKKLMPPTNLQELVNGKIERREYFDLPSGLKVSLQHPYMARAKTTSIRPQEMLVFARSKGCQVVIGANFHVSETVLDWDMDLGQRVGQEIGTIKHGSHFERHKMKTVDQGVGYLRIRSKGGRIYMTESAFYGGSKQVPPVDNLAIINSFLMGLDVDSVKDLNKS
ncbi:MAG: hypothetical protein AAB784_03770 [Patescibacteria group bacterium]